MSVPVEKIMDFSGMYFKVKGVLDADSDVIELDEVEAASNVHADVAAELNKIIDALAAAGVVVKIPAA